MSDAARNSASNTRDRGGIRDTLEQFTVALILAFLFRAFIVEAFVIPTGSMAPTLYGAHGTIICEDCGVEFAYGLRDLGDPREVVPVMGRSRAVCPNCNHANTGLRVNDEERNAEKGDRILVLKWPFDIGGRLLAPARWDVTVFKDPSDGVTNFIKRQVGLPNEVLMITDGDVYTVPTAGLSEEALSTLDRLRREKYELQSGIRDYPPLPPVPPKVLAELDEKMTIARKTPAAQGQLWFRVYDNDFPPRTPENDQPRWSAALGPDSGWDTSGRRLLFESRGASADCVELAGKRILATCAYNVHDQSSPPPVSDLRIRLVLTPRSVEGTLRLRLEKLRRAFWATIQMDGLVTLTESYDLPEAGAPLMASRRLPPLVPGKSVEISFQNVDYRLTLRVAGEEVLTSSDDPTHPAFYAPDLKSLRNTRPKASTPPRIYGADGQFELSHVVVERDAYYYHPTSATGGHSSRWGPRWTGWGSPDFPILLRENEFFMLGDNTSASKDSRLWDQVGPHLAARGESFQLGTVPEDQLIGRAFFVYWPSGYRLEWLPLPGLNRLGLIPDVGRMRWIR